MQDADRPIALLEAYAMDQLAPAERADVARRLAAEPGLQAELNAIENALHQLAFAEALPPPPALKNRVLDAVDAAVQQTINPTLATGKAKKRNPAIGVAVAMGTMAMLAMVLLIFQINSRLQRTEQHVAQLQNQALTADSIARRSQLAAQNLSLEMTLTHKGFRQVNLEPMKDSLRASAIVYWNGKDGEVYFMGRLPAPPPGKQYQLWAMVDNKPVDLGVLGVQPNGVLEPMKAIPGAQAFAVTLEPMGGKPQPTLEALTVMGKVQPA